MSEAFSDPDSVQSAPPTPAEMLSRRLSNRLGFEHLALSKQVDAQRAALQSELEAALQHTTPTSLADWQRIASTLSPALRDTFDIHGGIVLHHAYTFSQDLMSQDDMAGYGGARGGSLFDVQGISLVPDNWFSFSGVTTPEQKIERKALVMRSLFADDLPATEASVRAAEERMVALREAYHDVPLFQGRHVVLAMTQDFFDPSLAARLKTKSGTFSHIRQSGYEITPKSYTGATNNALARSEYSPAAKEKMQKEMDMKKRMPAVNEHPTDAMLTQWKEKLITSIHNTPPPATFYLSSHGLPGALQIAERRSENGYVHGFPNPDAFVKAPVTRRNPTGGETYPDLITAKELADAFRQRAALFPQLASASPAQQDILILDACYMLETGKTLYNQLGDAPKPIIITPSAESNLADTAFGNFLTQKDMQPTLGFVLQNDHWGNYISPSKRQATNPQANASMLVPSRLKGMQISRNSSTNPQRTIS